MAVQQIKSTSKRALENKPAGVDFAGLMRFSDLRNLRAEILTVGRWIEAAAGDSALTLNSGESSPTNMLTLRSTLAGADGNIQRISWFVEDDVSTSVEIAQLDVICNDASATTTDASMEINLIQNGTMVTVLDVNSSAAGTVTSTWERGDVVMNDNVSIQFGTAGAESDLSSDGTNTIWTSTSGILNLVADVATTGNAVQLSADGITSGTGLDISHTTAVLTTGSVLSVSSTSVDTGTAQGTLLDLSSSASTAGTIVQLAADALTGGKGFVASFDGLTTGEGFDITHTTSVIADGGSLFRLTSTGIDIGGATAGTIFDISSTAQLAGTIARLDSIVTTGTTLGVISTGAYTGTTGVLSVTATNATIGDIVVLIGGGAGQATADGSLLKLDNDGHTDGTTLEVNNTTGVYVGTKGIVDINGTATTSGTIVNIDGIGIVDGKILQLNATQATLTTGVYLECFDAAAVDFSVGRYGATIIAGLATGTPALSITAGDILLSDGAVGATLMDIVVGAVDADALDISGGLITAAAIDTDCAARTGGALYDTDIITSVLTASTSIYDTLVSTAHDGVGADTLDGSIITWSGAVPNGTADSSMRLHGSVYSGTWGSGGAEGGSLSCFNADLTGATINGSAANVYGVYVSTAGLTRTSANSVYGIYSLVDATDDAAVYTSDGTNTVALSDGTNAITVATGISALQAITGTTIDATTDFTIGTLVLTDDTITTTATLTTAMATPTVGTGFDGAAIAQWVPYGRFGATGLFVTEFIVDLTNLIVSTTVDDIIGESAAVANCNFGQITAAIHGTVIAIEMICLEAPAGADADIDLWSAVEETGAENALVTDLTETALLTSGAAWTNGRVLGATVMPAADAYLYLTNGVGGGAGTYTAGKFKIRIYGT